jgi:hypothetical protein
MKKCLGVAVAALFLSTVSVRANNCYPMKVDAGGSLHIHVNTGSYAPLQAGPWYLYWPLEAHFVLPAPTGYPYWPGNQVLPNIAIGGPNPAAGYPPPPVPPPPGPALPPAAVPVPPPPPPAAAAPVLPSGYYYPTALQRTSYYQAPGYYQAPSYWYGR